MFDNKQDVLTIVKKQEESHGKMLLEMGRVGNALVNIEKMLSKTVASFTEEIIVLQTFDQPFAANGYLYNSLIIGDNAQNDNAKLIVTKGGVSYTVVLLAGDNAINIPDGANIRVTTTSGLAVTAILTRYNTPGNNDTNITLNGGAAKITDGTNNITLVNTTGDSYVPNTITLPSIGYPYGFNGGTWDRLRSIALSGSDGWVPPTKGALAVAAHGLSFNGTTFDRNYNNTQGTLLASAARTAQTVSPQQTNYNGRALIIFLNVTAASGTGGLTVKVNNIDPISGVATQIAPTGAAITTTGLFAFAIAPYATQTGFYGAAISSISRNFSVQVNVGDATSYTYSLGYALIL